MSSAIRWLMASINETIIDRTEDDDNEPAPLIPMLEEDCDAMEDETFLNMLRKISISEPVEGQVLNFPSSHQSIFFNTHIVGSL